MARKGILSPGGTKATRDAPAPPAPRRGAVGALQSSLARLQEGAVQEIDAGLIDEAGFEDRLGIDPEAQAALRDSIEAHGQQVPVLLRPHPKTPGRYEIVYGRRRLRALRDLGRPVRAMVRTLDDQALVLAQGQENSARQDLSFIEKAAFAAQLERAGYDRPTIAAALSTDQPMISRLVKVGTAFDMDLLRAIGPAPSIGRARWTAFAKLLEQDGPRARVNAFRATPDFRGGSDQRFEMLFERASPKKPPAPSGARAIEAADGTALGEGRLTRSALTLKVPAGSGFAAWLDARAPELLRSLHEEWRAERDSPATQQGGTDTGG